jgi:single-strand DNA-binding protein
MFNKVILIGNLTRDPELRYTPQGTAVATFRLAVNSNYKSGGDGKKETLFIDVVVFGKQAEPCSQYLSKGRPALVEGRLQEGRWEKDGQQHSKMEVIAQTVRFLGQKGSQDDSPDTAGADAGGYSETTDLEPF